MTEPHIIHNGDHAEFEIEHANTPPHERPDWPLPSFDARDWAKAFCDMFPGSDEALMLAWFANALMRGYDERAARISHLESENAALRERQMPRVEWDKADGVVNYYRARIGPFLVGRILQTSDGLWHAVANNRTIEVAYPDEQSARAAVEEAVKTALSGGKNA